MWLEIMMDNISGSDTPDDCSFTDVAGNKPPCWQPTCEVPVDRLFKNIDDDIRSSKQNLMRIEMADYGMPFVF